MTASARAHVVHVIHALRAGGLESGVLNVINHTQEFRHTVVCLTGVSGWRDRLPASVRVIAAGKSEGRSLWFPLHLAMLLRPLRPHIVHTRNWAAFDAVPAARLAGVARVVHSEHGREAIDPQGRNVWRNRLRRLLHPCVDRFVAVSEDLRRWVVGTVGVPPRKVQVIANGVDTERFRDDRRIDARRALGLDDREFVVGSVGRLDPVKDYPTLLEAFAALGGRHPSPLLLLAGDGPQRSALEAQVVNSGLTERVQLLGERDDIPAVLAALDVFVLPSIAGGMSNVILEAMSSGVPVVATAVGGNPELVLDGSTGRLVPPRSPGLLAAALGSYLAEPSLLRLHGKAGRERVLAHFSLDRMVTAYRDLYHSLLPGSLG